MRIKDKEYEESVFLNIKDFELECKATFAFVPGDPGRLSGPPEFCYPPESDEYEIFKLMTVSNKESQDVSCLLDVPEIYDMIEAQLMEFREDRQ